MNIELSKEKSCKYLIIGGGFILEKHLSAIKSTDGEVVAIVNRSDSIGIIGNYYNKAEYYNKISTEKLREYAKEGVIPVIITATHIHYTNLRKLIKAGFKKIIVEKPPVSNLIELDRILKLAKKYSVEIYPVLQARYSSSNELMFKQWIKDNQFDYDIKIYSPRGLWYYKSWKADYKASGGLLMNIGIHIIDLILHDFLYYTTDEKVYVSIFKEYLDNKTAILSFYINAYCITLKISISQSYISERTIEVNNSSYDIEFKHEDFYKAFIKDDTVHLIEEEGYFRFLYKLIEHLSNKDNIEFKKTVMTRKLEKAK